MKQAKSPASVEIKVERAPDFKQIYASGVYGGHTPSEFRMQFYRDTMEVQEGIAREIPQPTMKREFLVEVVVSPTQAKMFADWLEHHIAEYEKTFGKIPMPPKTELPGKPPTTPYV